MDIVPTYAIHAAEIPSVSYKYYIISYRYILSGFNQMCEEVVGPLQPDQWPVGSGESLELETRNREALRQAIRNRQTMYRWKRKHFSKFIAVAVWLSVKCVTLVGKNAFNPLASNTYSTVPTASVFMSSSNYTCQLLVIKWVPPHTYQLLRFSWAPPHTYHLLL